jgi:hypothetical protein
MKRIHEDSLQRFLSLSLALPLFQYPSLTGRMADRQGNRGAGAAVFDRTLKIEASGPVTLLQPPARVLISPRLPCATSRRMVASQKQPFSIIDLKERINN